jgi:hypothetical protein
MSYQNDAPEIREKLNGRLEEMLSQFWSGWIKRGNCAYPEPKDRKDTGSFVVYLGAHGRHSRGKWFRNSKDAGGDELNLFAYGHSGGRTHHADADTFRAARQWLGMTATSYDTPERQEERARAHRQSKA